MEKIEQTNINSTEMKNKDKKKNWESIYWNYWQRRIVGG
jgi:hypothetical protein